MPGDDPASLSPLDLSYALRTVLGTGRHFRSAIKLYMGFGMRQQAVELALTVDPTLARKLAQERVELDERKCLWLLIAKTAATSGSGGTDVVSRVVSVLLDCGPDVLSVEDVLPFLPDFAQIDQITDAICEALTSSLSKIERLCPRKICPYEKRYNRGSRNNFCQQKETNQGDSNKNDVDKLIKSGGVVLSSSSSPSSSSSQDRSTLSRLMSSFAVRW